jgi:hypothetical protein
LQWHKLGRIHNIQDVKIADCNWIKEGNQRVDVDIETNTGQARLVESSVPNVASFSWLSIFEKKTYMCSLKDISILSTSLVCPVFISIANIRPLFYFLP